MRTMVAPGRWRDDGPQAAHAKTNHYAISAVTGAAMVPVIVGNMPQTVAEKARRERRTERERCGKMMPRLKVPCFRRVGHKKSCQSEEYVVAWNAYRSRR